MNSSLLYLWRFAGGASMATARASPAAHPGRRGLPHPPAPTCNSATRRATCSTSRSGLEEKDAAATRGWFRVDPGQCKTVLQGALTADKAYVHAARTWRPTGLRRCRRRATRISASRTAISSSRRAKACQRAIRPAAGALLADQAVRDRAGPHRLSRRGGRLRARRRRGSPASSGCW